MHAAINRFGGILNELFEARRHAFFDTVITAGLGIGEFFCKIEFGKHGVNGPA